MAFKIKLGVSAKHLHLSKEDVAVLFGTDACLQAVKYLGQPGEFASEEKVDLVTEKAVLKGVRVIGPIRAKTQVELAMTDARTLGLNPPLRESGYVTGSAGVKIVGPKGEVELKEGVIIAERHVHLDTKTASEWGLKNQDRVKVSVPGERAVVFENVIVRVKDTYAPEFHIDTDEGNACFAENDQMVDVIF